VTDARGQAQQNGRIKPFTQLEGSNGHILRFLAIAGLKAGDAGELGKGAVVLLILAGMHGWIIGGYNHQASLHTSHRSIH
jgi:hypothetical protein